MFLVENCQNANIWTRWGVRAKIRVKIQNKNEKKKSKNFLQRILRFFRSKKSKGNVEKQETDDTGDVAGSQASDEDDNEIIAICGKSEEEKEKESAVVTPIITTTKPPLPGNRSHSSLSDTPAIRRQTSAQLGHHLTHPPDVPAGRGSQAVQALHCRQQGEHQELQAGPQSNGGAGGESQW